MKRNLSIYLFLLVANGLSAQYTFKATVKDSANGTSIIGATIILDHTTKGVATDIDGRGVLDGITAGMHTFSVSFIGYNSKDIVLQFPGRDSITVLLSSTAQNLEEAVITSTRTNSRMEDLPTKIEVIGAEDVEEENSMQPANIASLLGDVSGMQVQQTSATSGNSDIKIQGLPGMYTQILRDGMSLFGGYSGGFSILQIPPADLKQIEIIKGSSSTLYGGGAIGGLINLISRVPEIGKQEVSVTLNQTSLLQTNMNIYLANRNQHIGYTFLAGGTYQAPRDVNGDGFSDVPRIYSFFVHPRLLLYPTKRSSVIIGYSGTFEQRTGGDMQVLDMHPDSVHQYFIQNNLMRHTLDLLSDVGLSHKDKVTVKATASLFDRDINTNLIQNLQAYQLSWYSEVSYFRPFRKNDFVTGANFLGENFQHPEDGYSVPDFTYSTVGIFAQDDWKPVQPFTLESGMRIDHQNRFGWFYLPRLSMLYKFTKDFSSRLNGGAGYIAPSPFDDDELDERLLPRVQPLAANTKAEYSAGANWDFNFNKPITGKLSITANQSFFYTWIKNPLDSMTVANGDIYYVNEPKPVYTEGSETYTRISYDALEIYLDYVYSYSIRAYDANRNMPLNARHKASTVITYEFFHHFRVSLEASLLSRQYLDDGSTRPGYPLFSPNLQYRIKNFTFVLNAENVLDYRETRYEPIIFGSPINPDFKELWAPIEGRVINFSINYRF